MFPLFLTMQVVTVDDETKKDIISHLEMKEDSSLQVVRLQGVKPNFETGSSQRLSFAKKVEEKKKAASNTTTGRLTNAHFLALTF